MAGSDPLDDEPVWRASFAAALDEAILQAVRVLSERVHRATGELAAGERACSAADFGRSDSRGPADGTERHTAGV